MTASDKKDLLPWVIKMLTMNGSEQMWKMEHLLNMSKCSISHIYFKAHYYTSHENAFK